MEEELKQLLLEVAQWVRGTAPEVWRIMLRQVMLEGILNVLGTLLCVGAGIGLYRVGRRLFEESREEDCYDSDSYTLPGTFCYILCACAAVVAVILIFLSISYFVNPEYYAIYALLDMMN